MMCKTSISTVQQSKVIFTKELIHIMETTDIWFASYLKFKGYVLEDFEVLHRGKGKYKFDITEEQWKTLKLEFSTSETNAIKSFHLSLKDMTY